MIWILIGGIPLAIGVSSFLWSLYREGVLLVAFGVLGALLAATACVVAVVYGIQQVTS